MSKALVVRSQALDGTWETIGVDRRYGIIPESVTCEADGWGSSRASFNLRRSPLLTYPDLGAFTPIEIEEAGRLIWAGRVSETPSQTGADEVINVQCEGLQYHLDDDVYSRMYIHTGLGDFIDMRASPIADLIALQLRQAYTVTTGSAITLAYPQGTPLLGGFTAAGVYVDLGPNNVATRVVVDWSHSNNAATVALVAFSSPTANFTGGSDAFAVTLNTGTAPLTSAGTVAAGRYVGVYLRYTGVAATTSADHWARVTGIRIFTDSAYESGNQSVLVSSTVINDALDRATTLLSSDRSQLQTTSFVIPSFDPGAQTPRQVWTAVDALQNWLKKIDVYGRPIYAPMPATATLDYGSWSGGEASDASLNSGQDIYSRALLTGQDVAGAPFSYYRAQGNSGDFLYSEILGGGSGGPGGSFAMSSSSPIFHKGVTYALRVASVTITSFAGAGTLNVAKMGLGTGLPWSAGDIVSYQDIPVSGNGTIGPFPYVLWTPTADRSGFGYSATWTGSFNFTINLEAAWGNTLPERRNFARTMQLPIDSTMPLNDTGPSDTVGDLWLGDHRSTPFKGSISVTGDSAIRETLTGQDVPAGVLLTRTGEIIRLIDRIDPDTGGLGREGRIAAVSYTPATQTAQITLDSQRDNLSALLSRLAVVVDNTA